DSATRPSRTAPGAVWARRRDSSASIWTDTSTDVDDRARLSPSRRDSVSSSMVSPAAKHPGTSSTVAHRLPSSSWIRTLKVVAPSISPSSLDACLLQDRVPQALRVVPPAVVGESDRPAPDPGHLDLVLAATFLGPPVSL